VLSAGAAGVGLVTAGVGTWLALAADGVVADTTRDTDERRSARNGGRIATGVAGLGAAVLLAGGTFFVIGLSE
jgi:hypothetical protein